MSIQDQLKAKIKQIHKIPPTDELDAQTEIFLDYFAKEILEFIRDHKEEL